MSEIPPAGTSPVTPDYQVQPIEEPVPDPRPLKIIDIVSWIVVILIVSATAISVALEQRRERAAPPADNGQLAASAKYAVGVHTLLPMVNTGEFLTKLDPNAVTPKDRFRMAILAAEISGKEEALRRLDALEGDSDALTEYPDLAIDTATARAIYSGQAALDTELDAFRSKWAWFGELADSFGRAHDDPVRMHMLAPTYRTMAGMFAMVTVGLVGGMLGLVLLIVAIVFFSTRRMQPAFASPAPGMPQLPADRSGYIQGFALFCLLLFGGGLLVKDVLNLPDIIVGLASLVLLPASFVVGLLWPRIAGGTWRQWRASFGLHMGRGFFREAFAGVVGYIAGIPLIILGFLVMLGLIELADVKPSHPINDVLGDANILVILLIFFAASIWAPISEELMFRGALFANLRERFGPFFSAAVVGLLFALVHPQGWPLVPVLGTIGLVFALIREWRGSIIACITAHALHNTLTIALALMLMS